MLSFTEEVKHNRAFLKLSEDLTLYEGDIIRLRAPGGAYVKRVSTSVRIGIPGGSKLVQRDYLGCWHDVPDKHSGFHVHFDRELGPDAHVIYLKPTNVDSWVGGKGQMKPIWLGQNEGGDSYKLTVKSKGGNRITLQSSDGFYYKRYLDTRLPFKGSDKPLIATVQKEEDPHSVFAVEIVQEAQERAFLKLSEDLTLYQGDIIRLRAPGGPYVKRVTTSVIDKKPDPYRLSLRAYVEKDYLGCWKNEPDAFSEFHVYFDRVAGPDAHVIYLKARNTESFWRHGIEKLTSESPLLEPIGSEWRSESGGNIPVWLYGLRSQDVSYDGRGITIKIQIIRDFQLAVKSKGGNRITLQSPDGFYYKRYLDTRLPFKGSDKPLIATVQKEEDPQSVFTVEIVRTLRP